MSQRERKSLIFIEISAVVFKLKKKTSKPMCSEAAPREFVARLIALYSIATARREGEEKDSA